MVRYRKILKDNNSNLNCPRCNSDNLFFKNTNYIRCNNCYYSFFAEKSLKNKSFIGLDNLKNSFKKYLQKMMTFSVKSLIDINILKNSFKKYTKILTISGYIFAICLILFLISIANPIILNTILEWFVIVVITCLVVYFFIAWFTARNSCPKCKTKFSKTLINKEFLGVARTERTDTGTKTYNRYKNTYKCKSCNFQWWEEHTDFI